MSQTLNINYDPYAPGTFALTFTVNGVAPNLSTGYGATMRIWRSGLPTTASPDVTVTAPGAIALGTSGSIILDLVVIHTALALVSSTEAVWSYDLIVTPTGAYSQKVCSGQLAEGVGSDAEADVSAPISVNWAGTVGGDLSGTLPNPTVDGLQGRTVASTAPTNGQVLAWNSTSSQWEPTTGGGGGSGTVTSITAGTGLTGGTITTSGTIAADIGTGATQVAAGNHTHTLAGDVQGDIATTVVHKVQGHEFSSGTPSNGDVWVYESSSTKWKHENLGTAGIAAAVHVHSGADITSGTVGISYLPTGTSGTTVALGNHTHAASDIVSGVLATARLASSGTASASTFLRGDQTWATPPGSTTIDTQEFYDDTTIAGGTATGTTWTKPSNAKLVFVELLGAGAGGANGGVGSGGLGGGSGGYACGWFNASDLGSTESISIGTGGAAGSNTTGGAAAFGTHIYAPGGRGSSSMNVFTGARSQTNWGGGGSTGAAGRVGGPQSGGGGGGGSTNTTAGGAGGAGNDYSMATSAPDIGGGSAGGAIGGNAGTDSTIPVGEFGRAHGPGGGGGNAAGTGGAGGDGARGAGGGGGGSGSTAGGAGGVGGNAYVRVLTYCWS